ncbi:MFS transporter [Lichenibacterium minor]|uniref:MFS transporter n=1 Tax=Lichenibacterium minor TaxID=2316528 RepID=A0A4Q2TZ66_9HYPH|nr:MFS transporter [Lichenibacterium minor]RYC29372.1 MFS transporter [Lichenibacterium minor]
MTVGVTAAAVPIRRWPVITALGVTQILAWGGSYYLPAVLAGPVFADTGWSPTWVVGGLSVGLLAAAAASPAVGRVIAQRGGRPVLAASAVLLAMGQCGLALAPSLPLFVAAWVVVGLGMAAGLYDPAFATLGRLYGAGGRSAITTLTLFGGFASTICWPLSAFLVTTLGWRGACLSYAGIQLAVSLPIYVLGLPREPAGTVAPTPSAPAGAPASPSSEPAPMLLPLLATAVTTASFVSTVLSVHLLGILERSGLALGAAVALGALVGPSQVGARAIELALSQRHHPIWTKLAASLLIVLGLVAMLAGGPWLTAALVLYGAGIGLESIARGTLPLALVGPRRYPVVMGRIALPNLMVQAASPLVGSMLLGAVGANGTITILVGVAGLNVLLSVALFTILRVAEW